jgi:hypothetical protein
MQIVADSVLGQSENVFTKRIEDAGGWVEVRCRDSSPGPSLSKMFAPTRVRVGIEEGIVVQAMVG